MEAGARVVVLEAHHGLSGSHGTIVRGLDGQGMCKVRVDGFPLEVQLLAKRYIRVIVRGKQSVNDLVSELLTATSEHATETASRTFGAAARRELQANVETAARLHLRTTAEDRASAIAEQVDSLAPNRNSNPAKRLARAARVVRAAAMAQRPGLRARLKMGALSSLDAVAVVCAQSEAEGCPIGDVAERFAKHVEDVVKLVLVAGGEGGVDNLVKTAAARCGALEMEIQRLKADVQTLIEGNVAVGGVRAQYAKLEELSERQEKIRRSMRHGLVSMGGSDVAGRLRAVARAASRRAEAVGASADEKISAAEADIATLRALVASARGERIGSLGNERAAARQLHAARIEAARRTEEAALALSRMFAAVQAERSLALKMSARERRGDRASIGAGHFAQRNAQLLQSVEQLRTVQRRAREMAEGVRSVADEAARVVVDAHTERRERVVVELQKESRRLDAEKRAALQRGAFDAAQRAQTTIEALSAVVADLSTWRASSYGEWSAAAAKLERADPRSAVGSASLGAQAGAVAAALTSAHGRTRHASSPSGVHSAQFAPPLAAPTPLPPTPRFASIPRGGGVVQSLGIMVTLSERAAVLGSTTVALDELFARTNPALPLRVGDFTALCSRHVAQHASAPPIAERGEGDRSILSRIFSAVDTAGDGELSIAVLRDSLLMVLGVQHRGTSAAVAEPPAAAPQEALAPLGTPRGRGAALSSFVPRALSASEAELTFSPRPPAAAPQEAIAPLGTPRGRGAALSSFVPQVLSASGHLGSGRGMTSMSVSHDRRTQPPAAAAVVAAASDEQRLRAMFDYADKSKDGQISVKEMMVALRHDEGLAALLHLPGHIHQEDGTRHEFEKVFSELDSDGDRMVTWDEFRAYFMARAALRRA